LNLHNDRRGRALVPVGVHRGDTVFVLNPVPNLIVTKTQSSDHLSLEENTGRGVFFLSIDAIPGNVVVVRRCPKQCHDSVFRDSIQTLGDARWKGIPRCDRL
jgi:hypothetical protein